MNTQFIHAYTRTFANETGAAMHLALSRKGESLTVLNSGFGILFPVCEFDKGGAEGQTKGIEKPWLFRKADSSFGIVALHRNPENGGKSVPEKGHENRVIFFSSKDLISYREDGLREITPIRSLVEDVQCCYNGSFYILLAYYSGAWHQFRSDDLISFSEVRENPVPVERVQLEIWGSEPACRLEITDDEASKLLQRFTAPKIPAEVKGFPFPFIPLRADPMAILENGKYLFIATDDEHNQNYLKIRQAAKLSDLANSKEYTVFQANNEGDMSGCIWAPELHRVNGKLCIFFAAGMPHWYTVQARVMILIGENPLDPACWSAPRRIVKADGSQLAPDGSITLDMTVLESKTGLYAIWSQRPVKTDPIECRTADLYIARLDKDYPWKIAGDTVVLCRPEYGWERIHSAVNEGPFSLKRDGRIFLVYSGAFIDSTYCLGLLETRDGEDLLEPGNWLKMNYPVLHRLSTPEHIGSGHCAFVKDEIGGDVMLFHALDMRNYRFDHSDWRRYTGIRPIVWDDSGFPHFDSKC